MYFTVCRYSSYAWIVQLLWSGGVVTGLSFFDFCRPSSRLAHLACWSLGATGRGRAWARYRRMSLSFSSGWATKVNGFGVKEGGHAARCR